MVNTSATVWDASTNNGERPVDTVGKTTLYSPFGDIESNLLGQKEYEHFLKMQIDPTVDTEITWSDFADETTVRRDSNWRTLLNFVKELNPTEAIEASYCFFNQDKLYTLLYQKLIQPWQDPSV